MADTWTRTTAPNRNFGTEDQMWSGVNGKKHAWVRWDQQQIAAVVGTGTLVSARAEFTIVSSLWSQTTGEFSIHRVTKEWTELGATSNCAVDTDTALYSDADSIRRDENRWDLVPVGGAGAVTRVRADAFASTDPYPCTVDCATIVYEHSAAPGSSTPASPATTSCSPRNTWSWRAGRP